MKKRRFNIFIVITVAVIGYFIYVAVEQQIYINNITQERIAVDEQLAKAKKENAELKQEKEALEDPQYIEKIAREELGMTKKDEIPYVSSNKK
ncbi:cell division protein FtsL [Pectinatus frisingensis]|uniref:cell division protein FtsL n=1 Tax=Pectinatus frisingensis TaxID=865 RepID=UPI001E408C9F